MSEGREDKPQGGSQARLSLRRAFGGSFLVFAAIAVLAGGLCYELKGAAAAERALRDMAEMLVYVVPRVIAAMLMAAFIQILVPRAAVARWIGEKAGFRGLIVATVAGMLTPGGPLTSFPIVVALHAAGANRGALVAYLSAWAMIGFQRMLIWEFPFMGPHFTFLHLAASLALPPIAGLIANRLPIRIAMPPAGGG